MSQKGASPVAAGILVPLDPQLVDQASWNKEYYMYINGHEPPLHCQKLNRSKEEVVEGRWSLFLESKLSGDSD